MSDSSIRLKPVIDEPSNPMPSASAPSSSSRPTAKLFSWPLMSVNQKRMNSTPSSSTRRRMSSGSVRGLVTVAICGASPFRVSLIGRGCARSEHSRPLRARFQSGSESMCGGRGKSLAHCRDFGPDPCTDCLVPIVEAGTGDPLSRDPGRVRGGCDLELAALHRHLDEGGIAAEALPALARGSTEAVEEVVGVQRVVVEEEHPPRADP